mgnify:CR=1 FL=1|jgi:Enoyl-CoA hydratase/carnithine racemase
MTHDRNLKVYAEGPVGIMQLDRPQKYNCLSMSIFEELEEAVGQFEEQKDVAALMICASGKNFCTGAELDEVETVRAHEDALKQFLHVGHRALDRLEQSPLPVIVAVEGLCLAGGLELMLACDIVIAGQSARFGDQHGQFGLVPGWGGSQRLPKVIGVRRALDLFLSVRWINAGVAEQWGLVNYVVADGEAYSAALQYAAKMADRSADGIARMKHLARVADSEQIQAAKKREIDAATSAVMGEAVSEGLMAFKEKRKPVFR